MRKWWKVRLRASDGWKLLRAEIPVARRMSGEKVAFTYELRYMKESGTAIALATGLFRASGQSRGLPSDSLLLLGERFVKLGGASSCPRLRLPCCSGSC